MKFLNALKIGYGVLKRIEQAEALGVIPAISIKGVPIDVIDAAGHATVDAIKKAHDDSKK